MSGRGLEKDGTIAREGALNRVPQVFAPVVDAARAQIAERFDSTRLHSAYLYGSIPRGAAIPGLSDLDLLIALHHEPTETDRSDATTIEAALDRSFIQINGVGILLSSARDLLSELERYDGGFFVACLCTPLLSSGLAEQLPRYHPTSLLARETNGDLSLPLAIPVPVGVGDPGFGYPWPWAVSRWLDGEVATVEGLGGSARTPSNWRSSWPPFRSSSPRSSRSRTRWPTGTGRRGPLSRRSTARSTARP